MSEDVTTDKEHSDRQTEFTSMRKEYSCRNSAYQITYP